jgi:carbamoyl-phosphate synthase large subunit
VKESVFPFARFSGVDIILGPEMRSTGEVMGIAADFPLAFAKSQLAAGVKLPTSGSIFISVKDDDKPSTVDLAKRLHALGFTLIATQGTAQYLSERGLSVQTVSKVYEGRPHAADKIADGEISLVINTTFGKQEISDSFSLRRGALMQGIPYYTTLEGAIGAVHALEALARGPMPVRPLQEYLGTHKA